MLSDLSVTLVFFNVRTIPQHKRENRHQLERSARDCERRCNTVTHHAIYERILEDVSTAASRRNPQIQQHTVNKATHTVNRINRLEDLFFSR